MCQFKSGIILKNRYYIAQGEDNSHTTLLEGLNFADTSEMHGSSTVSRMHGSSIVRDYKNKKIYIAEETNMEVVKKK